MKEASAADEVASENIVEAVSEEADAVEAYAEAVKDESEAADAVVEAVKAESIAAEAVIEATEQVTDLVEKEAKEEQIQEAVSDLKEAVEEQAKSETVVAEAIATEEKAVEAVETTSEEEKTAAKKLEKAVEEKDNTVKELENAVIKEELAEEEVKETVEAVTDKKSESIPELDHESPFKGGEIVAHGVYGEGEVIRSTKAGNHWSVEVNFDEGKRRILGTFLTRKKGGVKSTAPSEDDFKRPESKTIEENSPVESKSKNIKEEKSEEKKEVITSVVAEAVKTDYGAYTPGTKIKHDIFGIGVVKDSQPKGENYKLELKFEDGSQRNLLSTFVNIVDGENETEEVVAEPAETEEVIAEAVVAEPAETEEVIAEAVVAEPAETEEVIAEAIVAEPVIADIEVVDTDAQYRRPEKKEEPVIDLSKPEVQDAEMVDDDE